MYFNIQVTKTADGNPACAIYTFDTLEAAKANHFYFLSSAYSNPALTYILGQVQNHWGQIVLNEQSGDPIDPEPTPEPEVTGE